MALFKQNGLLLATANDRLDNRIFRLVSFKFCRGGTVSLLRESKVSIKSRVKSNVRTNKSKC